MLKLLLLVPFIALIANMAFLDYQYLLVSKQLNESKINEQSLRDRISLIEGKPSTIVKTETKLEPVAQNSCPQTCLDAISVVSKSIPKTQTSTVNKTVVNTSSEYYVPLGSGSTNVTGEWVIIDGAQASFNPSDYPKGSAIYFEVVLHVQTSGEVQARLYDSTTPIIYAGEVVKTQSLSGDLQSVQMKFLPSGSKTYKVQLLTSISPAILDSARIRIVTK